MATSNPPFLQGQDRVDLISEISQPLGNTTIATTSNTELYYVVPFRSSTARTRWSLAAATFAALAALAASDVNFVSFTITNITNSNAVMLAATAANTTQATGGSAIAATTFRALALTSTAASLAVKGGDVLRVRFAATGTLVGAVTNANVTLLFQEVLVK